VFLSEYGIGSQMNAINEWRHFEQVGAQPDPYLVPRAASLFNRPAMDDGRHRMDDQGASVPIPSSGGYNLTGILDHGMTGEGLWAYWREWKPATFDAVADGWRFMWRIPPHCPSSEATWCSGT